MESVGHRVAVFLVLVDTRIDGVAGAKQAAMAVIDNGSKLTVAPVERVRELSGGLRLVKAERPKGLHTKGEDVCVKYQRGRWTRLGRASTHYASTAHCLPTRRLS